jgi:hypothetical protein
LSAPQLLLQQLKVSPNQPRLKGVRPDTLFAGSTAGVLGYFNAYPGHSKTLGPRARHEPLITKLPDPGL